MLPPVSRLTQLQIDCVKRWHQHPIENPYDDFESLVCRQHEFNFRLWHDEDTARSPTASDAEVANVKRAIDRYNQQRNDMIERLDDAITERLLTAGILPFAGAPINTETPGSAIDRLSIMSLRLYHYAEQRERTDADESHQQRVSERIVLCETQHADLAFSLQTLIDDLWAGRKRHKTYRQMKMYNDSTLNPAIYAATKPGTSAFPG